MGAAREEGEQGEGDRSQDEGNHGGEGSGSGTIGIVRASEQELLEGFEQRRDVL